MTFWHDPTMGAGRDMFGDSVRRALDSIAKFLRATPPVGTMHVFCGLEAALPDGYLLCYGQTVNIGDYNDLYTAISTNWNTGGEAAGTFRLPDFRGLTPLGRDNMGGSQTATTQRQVGGVLGSTGGERQHALIIAELAAHTHQFTYRDDTVGVGAGSAAAQLQSGFDNNLHNLDAHPPIGSTGSGTAHNNLQPYGLVNWIIRY